jgi:hypothetical protein
VYGASWVALIILVGLPLQAFAALIPEPTLSAMAAAAAGLWLAGAFYASLYFSVVECFDASQNTDTPDWQTQEPPQA